VNGDRSLIEATPSPILAALALALLLLAAVATRGLL
jgi:hypothetical protein